MIRCLDRLLCDYGFKDSNFMKRYFAKLNERSKEEIKTEESKILEMIEKHGLRFDGDQQYVQLLLNSIDSPLFFDCLKILFDAKKEYDEKKIIDCYR